MKKIFSLFIVLSLLFTGCDEWLDVNTPENLPTEVSAELILPAAQASLATRLGSNLFNLGGFLAQYWTQAPEANQYNDWTTYDFKTDFMDNDYRELFAGGLNDLERVRTEASEVEDWGNYLAATVLRAYIFQVWVDIVDKSPYSEALKGTEFTNPAWEEGSAVYNGILSEIDGALEKVTGESSVASTDLLLGSDMNEWVGFANALKLKLLMRTSNVDDVSSEVDDLLTEGNFMSADVAFDAFSSSDENKRNPWYEVTQQLNTDRNHVGTVNIIRFLSAKNDPRLEVLFAPAESSETYEGFYPALKEVAQGYLTTDFSRPTVAADQPVYIYSMAELYLFIAEAELRFNNDKAKAKAAYEKAVDAGLTTKGIDPASVDLYSEGKSYYFDTGDSNDELMEQIMMQKWVALCEVNNFEAWCELRRTDIPKYFGDYSDYGDGIDYVPGQYLDPAKNLLPSGYHVPNRMPYPDVAVTRNANTPKLTGTEGLTNKVWWDNN